ncbi:hypothetical protein COMNV_00492 [Commensalibacter sp. Nvir]|uniref:PqiC family protein n=1 Tax=Commensalibacter sp. Nvir TaxID=3069817 RepID=UPI002D304316|nr:hypothetical protein COMNV_00492 [Commensalibacter sp. Nvir]
MSRVNNCINRSRRYVLKGGMALPLGFCVLSTLAACGNASPDYYTLVPYPGKIYLSSPRIVEVRNSSLAGFLDKDRIVKEVYAGQMSMYVSSAWGENLVDMIGRTVMLNLVQRLPNSRIFLQNQATSTLPQAYVEMDIFKFNQNRSGNAVLEANLVMYRRDQQQTAISKYINLELKPYTHSSQALVITLSQLLAKVSDIAAQGLVNIGSF